MAATRVLFLAGMGRSGTTLLERVVGELAGVQPLGEVQHLWQRGIIDNELCGCGQPFHDCTFWVAVGARAFGGWDRVDVPRVEYLRGVLDRARNIPRLARRDAVTGWSPELAEYAGYYRRLYDAAAQVSSARLLIDSSKQVSLPYCLARQPGIDLRVLHCVRDSRGVAYSWTKEVVRPERADAALMPRYSPWSMSLQWLVHNAGLAFLPWLGVPLMRLRYEDFISRPQETLSRVARFALDEVPEVTPFLEGRMVTLLPSHTVSGNPLRFRPGPIEMRVDDAWRTDLPAAQRGLVTALTLPLLVRYRYRIGWQKPRQTK